MTVLFAPDERRGLDGRENKSVAFVLPHLLFLWRGAPKLCVRTCGDSVTSGIDYCAQRNPRKNLCAFF